MQLSFPLFIVAMLLLAGFAWRHHAKSSAAAEASSKPKKISLSQFITIMLVYIFALLGGIAINPVHRETPDSENPIYEANTRLEHLFFLDRERRSRMDIGMRSGQASQAFYSPYGGGQLVVGTYTNDFGSLEKGLPCLGLYNNFSGLQGFFRLDGPNQSALLLFKNNADQGKMILGIDLVGPEDPFLVYYDKTGKEHALFGSLRR